jgi:hypothetical protein
MQLISLALVNLPHSFGAWVNSGGLVEDALTLRTADYSPTYGDVTIRQGREWNTRSR